MKEPNFDLVIKKTEGGWEASIPAVGIKEFGKNEDEAMDKATNTFCQQEKKLMDRNPDGVRFNIR